jgi:hypothetical protein
MSELENEVWKFPIYEYGSKKYIPLKYALPIAYIVPTLTILLLSPLANDNALLFQLEYMFIAFVFGFVGVLTRSKLRSFLNFIPAILSYATIEFVLQGLFNPPLANPYGAFNVLAEPISSIATNLGISGLESLIVILPVIDVIVILLIAQIGGFFLSVISTGFWNPKGEFGVLSVFSKIIAIPFVIMFIIVLPIFLHAGGSVVGGAAYIGAGAIELQGLTGGGGQSAQVDLGNLDIDDLRARSERASYFFSRANSKLGQVKGNIFVGVAVQQFVSSSPEYQSFENITNILDLVGSISEITYVLPELILGFDSLTKGFKNTLGLIGDASTTYDPNFNTGLTQLSYAFGNFSEAWVTTDDSGKQRGLFRAIEIASALKDIQGLEKFINIGEFVDALNKSITTLLDLDKAFIQFLNGTYKIVIGMNFLGNNDLNSADQWLSAGLTDFIKSKTELDAVERPGQVNFTVNLGETSTVVEIPIDGVINIARDMNALLIPFGFAAKDSIQLFTSMDSVMTSMDNLNWSDADEISDQTYWNGLTVELQKTQGYYDLAFANITEAEIVVNDIKDNSYGKLLNPVFTGENGFFSKLSSQVTTMKTNMSDFKFILQGFANTTFAFRDYSFGMGEFNRWYDDYIASGNTTSNNNTLDSAFGNFTSSQNYAVAGYDVIGLTTGINDEVRANWKSMLYNPSNKSDISTIYGADESAISTINLIKSSGPDDPNFAIIMSYVEQLQLAGILGGD